MTPSSIQHVFFPQKKKKKKKKLGEIQCASNRLKVTKDKHVQIKQRKTKIRMKDCTIKANLQQKTLGYAFP